jgi:hypothetical protein
LAFLAKIRHPRRVTPRPHADLVAHLVRSTPLSEGEADRVVAEVLAWFAEPVAEFVRRRHRELAVRGLTNDRIFAVVGAELAGRLVPPPPLTPRQLRRMVYG